MAKSKQKTITVFNTGGRIYSDVYTTPEGKHLDLEPGKSLDLPASVAGFLMTSYPREIVSARPSNANETKELAGREAAVEKREVKAAEREATLDERELELTAREEDLAKAPTDAVNEHPHAEEGDGE